MSKRIVIILFLVLACIIGAYYYTQRDFRNDIVNKEALFQLDAKALIAEYEMGEAHANDRYLGKTIAVNGTIRSVEREGGEVTIFLDAGDPLSEVVCEMNMNVAQDYSDYRTGDQVVIKGECSGKLMDIILVNCVIDTK
jgi:hypothetical protein